MKVLRTVEEKLAFKQVIKDACVSALQQRIHTARNAMQQAQESANSEEKSSAGDKHETSRAMSQLETEMNARQLAQAQRDLEALEKLSVSTISSKVSIGSVAISEHDIFFIGAGLGNIKAGEESIIAISPTAPIALQLMSKRAGDSFQFKGKPNLLADIF